MASAVWKQLERDGLLNGRTAKEINLVFDNCTGQNKNRMVLRMLFFLIKLHVCRRVNAIFLVKGHTKNDCDRLFNLLKWYYRNVDVFTPPELMELLNRHIQVDAVAMEPQDFKDWDELEERMMNRPKKTSEYHIFSVDSSVDNGNSLICYKCDGAPEELQPMVTRNFQDCDWQPLFKLQGVVPPGLPDIKWLELYSKWGRFVPQDRKSGLKYFVEEPPKEIKERIKKQSKASRDARSKRSRGAAEKENSCPNKQKK